MSKNKNTTRKITIFGLLFSIVYLISEIVFNITLVDFINSPNTEISRFEQLETLGRILSSLGLSIFFMNLFRIKKFAINVLILIVFSGGFYFSQNYMFERILDNMSPTAKLQAYSLGVYRNLAVNSESFDEKDNIYLPDDHKYNEVLNSMIGVALLNPKMNNTVNDYVKEFFDLNLNFSDEELSNIYDKLYSINNNDQVNELWKMYVIENKRYNNYQGFFKKEYEKRFTQSLGLAPNATKDEFIAFLKSKQEGIEKLDDLIIVPENKTLGLNALYLKDIPTYFDKGEWINYIKNYVKKGLDSVALNVDNIDNLPYSKSVISSVVIVPIAIVLSFISIILNICILAGAIHRLFAGLIVVVVLSMFTFHLFAMNYYQLPSWSNSMLHLEKYNVAIFDKAREFLHDRLINDETPNYKNIIRIEKPEIPNLQENYDELNAKFEEFSKQTVEFESQTQIKREDLKIDDEKLEDKGYYGEVDKKNPYLK